MSEFKLGFKILADLLGGVAGSPLEDEHYQANGDSLQQTSTGLMVWRKVDNWTAFTDGYRTWVNGPYGLQDRLNDERFDWEAVPIIRKNPPRRFAVWLGVSIDPKYSTISDIAADIAVLCPPGDWAKEVLIKAGEGGSWQAEFDKHPLAVSGAAMLGILCEQGEAVGLKVTPYFIVRGKPAWVPGEVDTIVQAAVAAGRVVLNLEPGAQYWNGPTDAQAVAASYLDPLRRLIRERGGENVTVEVAGIPRQWVVDALGGDNAMNVWAEHAERMSWECYDKSAADLDVALSMDRVREWLSDVPNAQGIEYRIPIVQQSRIAAWAGTHYADGGLEVWFLNGD
jgi:hypothetical protein